MDRTDPIALMRLGKVVQTTGLARSTIYKLVAQREFPAPVRLTSRAVAWPSNEVYAWIGARKRTR